MGTGKSTLGRHLAQHWHTRFIDTDHEIERMTKMRIPEIFAQKGEEEFRRLERDWVDNHMPEGGCVVATGGGLVIPEGMAELLKTKGVVMCLHASLETILKRTAGHRHRPLLNVEDPEARIRTLYAERDPIYRQAGTVILTDARPMADIINHVLRAYRREATDWAKAHGTKP